MKDTNGRDGGGGGQLGFPRIDPYVSDQTVAVPFHNGSPTLSPRCSGVQKKKKLMLFAAAKCTSTGTGVE
jgi:hypothetical protein